MRMPGDQQRDARARAKPGPSGNKYIYRRRPILIQRLPHAHALETPVAITWIIKPPLAPRREKGADVSPPQMEKGTPDPRATVNKYSRCHTGETGRIGLRPALPHGNRFDLVIGAMGGDDAEGSYVLSGIGEEPIARCPRSRLKSCRRLIAQPLADGMRNAFFSAESRDRACFLGGFRPQRMVNGTG